MVRPPLVRVWPAYPETLPGQRPPKMPLMKGDDFLILVLFRNLYRVVDGGSGGDIEPVEDFVHRHTHDGGGRRQDARKVPILCVLCNVLVQFRAVFGHAANHILDVLRLLFVGVFPVKGVLLPPLQETRPVQPLLEEFPRRTDGKNPRE